LSVLASHTNPVVFSLSSAVQYHFSISKAKLTSSICTGNIEKDSSIPNTALSLSTRTRSISQFYYDRQIECSELLDALS
jgi:hypothetical protein